MKGNKENKLFFYSVSPIKSPHKPKTSSTNSFANKERKTRDENREKFMSINSEEIVASLSKPAFTVSESCFSSDFEYDDTSKGNIKQKRLEMENFTMKTQFYKLVAEIEELKEDLKEKQATVENKKEELFAEHLQVLKLEKWLSLNDEKAEKNKEMSEMKRKKAAELARKEESESKESLKEELERLIVEEISRLTERNRALIDRLEQNKRKQIVLIGQRVEANKEVEIYEKRLYAESSKLKDVEVKLAKVESIHVIR